MTEWYVLMEGGNPVRVILGRLDALSRLTDGFKITRDEQRALGKFLESGICDLGTGLHFAGYETPSGEKKLDRKLIRVVGPGTEV